MVMIARAFCIVLLVLLTVQHLQVYAATVASEDEPADHDRLVVIPNKSVNIIDEEKQQQNTRITETSTCEDTTDLFEVVEPNGWTKMKGCDWVAEMSTNWRCGRPGVRAQCPVTCNACCSDMIDKYEVSIGTFAGKMKSCSWAADKVHPRCNDPAAQEACPRSCGTCPGQSTQNEQTSLSWTSASKGKGGKGYNTSSPSPPLPSSGISSSPTTSPASKGKGGKGYNTSSPSPPLPPSGISSSPTTSPTSKGKGGKGYNNTPSPSPSPSISPSSGISTSPSMLPSLTISDVPSEVPTPTISECKDSTDLFEVVEPNGRTKMRGCDWVAEMSTNWRCDRPGVRAQCPVTCNACCSDMEDKYEVSIGTFAGKMKSCAWAADKVHPRCNDPAAQQEACPRSCGTCLSTPSPSIAPSISACKDTTQRFEVVEPGGKTKMKGCDWVVETQTNWRCDRPGVRAQCPVTCGACCVDSEDKFEVTIGTFAGKMKSCTWVADKVHPRCNDPAAQEACPRSCGTCIELTPSPTPTPSTSSPTEYYDWCKDSTDAFEIPSLWWIENKKTCDWAAKSNPWWKCKTFEVQYNCPEVCGTCNCKNNEGRFKVNGQMRTCSWAAEKTWWRCNNLNSVRRNCPLLCGECEQELQFPSVSPSSSPTILRLPVITSHTTIVIPLDELLRETDPDDLLLQQTAVTEAVIPLIPSDSFVTGVEFVYATERQGNTAGYIIITCCKTFTSCLSLELCSGARSYCDDVLEGGETGSDGAASSELNAAIQKNFAALGRDFLTVIGNTESDPVETTDCYDVVVDPTAIPSGVPSPSPSVSPTKTVSPTEAPSNKPTIKVSPTPSIFTSGSPSVNPSGVPSPSPSVSPSKKPTIKPSPKPSGVPSASMEPSETPSIEPSTTLSSQPSSA